MKKSSCKYGHDGKKKKGSSRNTGDASAENGGDDDMFVELQSSHGTGTDYGVIDLEANGDSELLVSHEDGGGDEEERRNRFISPQRYSKPKNNFAVSSSGAYEEYINTMDHSGVYTNGSPGGNGIVSSSNTGWRSYAKKIPLIGQYFDSSRTVVYANGRVATIEEESPPVVELNETETKASRVSVAIIVTLAIIFIIGWFVYANSLY